MNRTLSSTTATVPAATTLFQGRPATPARARQAARVFLDSMAPAVEPDTAETVVLVVSELVTNAVRHAGGVCSLRLVTRPHGIEIAVVDPSARPPHMRQPDLTGDTGGFGWQMVQHLAHSVSVAPRRNGGKTVRALLPQ
ncbi:ATP-binding protein [Streptomyces sp. Pv4-95]|uniref:ATP-binding protein n=1 Tax=Streptomyces sp. Pv4-95 TaxID=3049543 RepID=UPI003891E1AF